MKRTSIEAYNEIKESGLLGKRMFEVYSLIYKHGPISANDLIRVVRAKGIDANQTGYNARFCELEQRGAIERSGFTVDILSRKRCNTYIVSGNLPVPPLKRLGRDNQTILNVLNHILTAVPEAEWKDYMKEVCADIMELV